MNNKFLLVYILLLILSTILGACGSQTATPQEPMPTVQTEVTKPPITSNIAVSNNYKELGEEELALLIHQTISEIEIVAKTAVTSTSSDNTLTDEEISESLASINTLHSAITLTHELIAIYTDHYAEITPETIGVLTAIDKDLDQITTHVNEIITILEKDASAITVNQFQTAMAPIESQTTTAQTEASNWFSNVQHQIEERQKLYANIQPQPSQVAYNRIDAFTQTHDFWDAAAEAFADDKLSTEELANMSQLAANAKASLYNTGDPELINIAQQVGKLMNNAILGKWTQTNNELVELKMLLPARPRP